MWRYTESPYLISIITFNSRIVVSLINVYTDIHINVISKIVYLQNKKSIRQRKSSINISKKIVSQITNKFEYLNNKFKKNHAVIVT